MPATLPWRKKGTKYVISEHVPWTLNNLFMCHDFPYPCQLLPVEPRRILIFDLTIRFTWRLCLPRSRIRCWTGLTWNVKLSFVAPVNLIKSNNILASSEPASGDALGESDLLLERHKLFPVASQLRCYHPVAEISGQENIEYICKCWANMKQMLGKYETKIGQILGEYLEIMKWNEDRIEHFYAHLSTSCLQFVHECRRLWKMFFFSRKSVKHQLVDKCAFEQNFDRPAGPDRQDVQGFFRWYGRNLFGIFRN